MRTLLNIILLFVFLGAGSCKKWLDVNVNPNDLAEGRATPNLLLPGILDRIGSNDEYFFYFDFLNRWMGYWCSPYASTGSPEQIYNINGLIINNLDPASSIAINVKLMENKARQSGQTFYLGISKVLNAMLFGNLVDLFNNIPYSEALQGAGKRFPAYEKGENIYPELIKELDSAIGYIRNAELSRNTRISQADILFKGDQNKWIKFANTLKLRLLIHQANRPEKENYIRQQIAIIIREGTGFLNAGEEAAVNPGYNANNYNSFYSQHGFFQGVPSFLADASANETSLNFLKENRDPRLAFFYNPAQFPLPADAQSPFSMLPPLTYRGNKYGLSVNALLFPYQSPPYISRLGGRTEDGPVTDASYGFFKGYDMDAWVLTSVESMFLQAEAIWRGWITGDAETAYKDAVKQSFRWLNVGGSMSNPSASDNLFEDWYQQEAALNNARVNWEAAPDKYKLLMFQKYIALNTIAPLEAWTDYRRNGTFPQIPLTLDPGRAAPALPLRMPYPLGEYQQNRDQVIKEGQINIFTDKIWWMP